MSIETYYQILGVPPTASTDEIRTRFRYLASAYHPDKFSNSSFKEQAAEDFKKINEAYQVLSDVKKRKLYDMQFSINDARTQENSRHQGQKTSQTANGTNYQNFLADMKRSYYGDEERGAMICREYGIGKAYIPWLISLLERYPIEYGPIAEVALKTIGVEAIEALVSSLERPNLNFKVYQIVRRIIRSNGSLAAPAVPALIRLLRKQNLDPQVYEIAFQIITRIGPPAASAVPDLVRLLKNPRLSNQAYIEACHALASIGKASEPAIPFLVKLLEYTNDLSIQNSATEALIEIGENALIPLRQLVIWLWFRLLFSSYDYNLEQAKESAQRAIKEIEKRNKWLR
jgi:curved DNA-binding protein CbpA